MAILEWAEFVHELLTVSREGKGGGEVLSGPEIEICYAISTERGRECCSFTQWFYKFWTQYRKLILVTPFMRNLRWLLLKSRIPYKISTRSVIMR